MKMYLVQGLHPTCPGKPTTATFDLAKANATAADLVATLHRDLMEVATLNDGGDAVEVNEVQPDKWRERLAAVQALAYSLSDGCSVEEAAEYLAPFSSDDVAQESGADVWIEEIEVEVPAPAIDTLPIRELLTAVDRDIFTDAPECQRAVDDVHDSAFAVRAMLDSAQPPATVRVWYGCFDGKNGTVLNAVMSERAIEDWMLEQVDRTREEYAAWQAVRDDPLPQPGAQPEGDGLDDFLQQYCEHCDSWSWESVDVPVPGVAQPVDLAQPLPLDTMQHYRRLADGLSDMIEEGRLTESDCPDDFAWLANLLGIISGADPGEPASIAAIRSQYVNGQSAAGRKLPDGADAVISTFAEGGVRADCLTDLVMLGMFQGEAWEALEEARARRSHRYTAETCPSKHHNDGADFCADCGEDLA